MVLTVDPRTARITEIRLPGDRCSDLEEANGETQADGDDGSDEGNTSESADSQENDSRDGTDASATSGDDGNGGDESTNENGSTRDSDADSDSGADEDGDNDTGDEDTDVGSGDEHDDDDGDGGNGDGNESDEPETHTLTVTVLDHEDNRLPNASVNVVTDPGTEGGEDVGSATTNENGITEFEVEDGAYEVSASHDDYQAAGIAGPIDVQGEDTDVEVTMPDPNGEDEDDEETHALTVRLANDEVDGVAVTLDRETHNDEEEFEPITKASAGGLVTFHDLEEGLYYVDAEGYNQTMAGISVDEDTEVTLQRPNPDPIAVTVVDAETGEPIEGTEIDGVCDLWYSSGDVYITGETDTNGVAQARAGVAPTECDARVEADSYETTHLPLSVPDDGGITIELTPAPADDNDNGNSTADGNETAVQAIAP